MAAHATLSNRVVMQKQTQVFLTEGTSISANLFVSYQPDLNVS